jgi:ABC-2 type transport system ATP-binding protein
MKTEQGTDATIPVVRCETLTKAFGASRAVDGLTFDVWPGEVFGLLGPDGAGKTTTMRMLTAIMEPSEGSATVLGHDTRREPQAIKERIGYVSQQFSLYGDLTVAENMEFVADLFRVRADARPDRMRSLLSACGMLPFSERLARDLSGGMRQKLALACALMHTPEVLFLDEPTTGVDPVSRREFWAILYGLVERGMTLVVSTPFMDEAERCDRIALMHLGRILVSGSPADLSRGYASLEDAFVARTANTATDGMPQ